MDKRRLLNATNQSQNQSIQPKKPDFYLRSVVLCVNI